jgi:hypothetical protein
MKQSKFSLSKLLLAAGIFVMAQHASAATYVPPGHVLDFRNAPTYQVLTAGDDWVEYQVLLKEGQNLLNITLLSSDQPNTPGSAFRLWEDIDTREDFFSKNITTQIEPRTEIGIGASLLWVIDPLKQYVLRINPFGGDRFSATTEISAVPVPGAIWLFGSALLGFLGFSNRRKI